MKKMLMLVAVVGLAGCGGYNTQETAAFSGPLGSYSLAKVAVTSDQPDGAAAAARFQDKMVAELIRAKVFPACAAADDQGQADVKVGVALETNGHRVAANVTVLDLKSGKELGAFTVDGKSSSWSSSGHAVDKTAIAVVDYLAKQK